MRDVAHPDTEEQKADVLKVMAELNVVPAEGAANDDDDTAAKPVVEALNKTDLLDEDEREYIANRARFGNQAAVPISAMTGTGCAELLDVVDDILTNHYLNRAIDLRFEDGAALAWLYERAEVLAREDRETGVHLDLRIAPDVAARFEQKFETVLQPR
jgi:GTP-binding protein HflX